MSTSPSNSQIEEKSISQVHAMRLVLNFLFLLIEDRCHSGFGPPPGPNFPFKHPLYHTW